MLTVGAGMPSPSSRLVVVATAGCLVLAGCGADEGLVDRVAEIEAQQQQLRAAVSELTQPDPDEQAAREEVATELAAVAGRVAELEEALTRLRRTVRTVREETTAAATTAATNGDRLDAVDGELGDLRASLSEVDAGLAELTDLVSSVRVQFDSHRDDPGAHAGAPGSP